MLKVTGIKRNWIINNNVPILDCLNDICVTSRARNVQTYDFSTLYTNLEHQEIKLALSSVIKLCFRLSKKKYIAVYNRSFSWINNPKPGTFCYDIATLMESVNFLIDNCYFTLGTKIFRQVK